MISNKERYQQEKIVVSQELLHPTTPLDNPWKCTSYSTSLDVFFQLAQHVDLLALYVQDIKLKMRKPIHGHVHKFNKYKLYKVYHWQPSFQVREIQKGFQPEIIEYKI